MKNSQNNSASGTLDNQIGTLESIVKSQEALRRQIETGDPRSGILESIIQELSPKLRLDILAAIPMPDAAFLLAHPRCIAWWPEEVRLEKCITFLRGNGYARHLPNTFKPLQLLKFVEQANSIVGEYDLKNNSNFSLSQEHLSESERAIVSDVYAKRLKKKATSLFPTLKPHIPTSVQFMLGKNPNFNPGRYLAFFDDWKRQMFIERINRYTSRFKRATQGDINMETYLSQAINIFFTPEIPRILDEDIPIRITPPSADIQGACCPWLVLDFEGEYMESIVNKEGEAINPHALVVHHYLTALKSRGHRVSVPKEMHPELLRQAYHRWADPMKNEMYDEVARILHI